MLSMAHEKEYDDKNNAAYDNDVRLRRGPCARPRPQSLPILIPETP